MAVREPHMRFVSPKSLDQQSMLASHRIRQGWNTERTALLNESADCWPSMASGSVDPRTRFLAAYRG